MPLLRMLLLLCASAMLMGASKVPSNRDGYRDGYVDDGKQNYPVKLYGIAIEWERDCRRGKAALCERLADGLYEGLGDLNVDPRGAVGYWLLACNGGIAGACTNAAQMIEAGMTHYPANPTLALATAQKGCTLGDSTSCAITALHQYRGVVTAQNRPQAIALWDSGCASGNEESCRMKAGALYHDSGDAASQQQAVALYQAGCDRLQGWGCSGLANALTTGVGAAADSTQAFAIGQKGCLEAKGDTVLACAIYARQLSNSRRVADVDRAGKLLTRACLAGVAEACNDAGLLGKRNPPGSGIANWEVALSFRDGCDLGYGPACGNLGLLYYDGSDMLKASDMRAVALWDKGCALGDAPSCSRVRSMGDNAAAMRNARSAIDPAATANAQLAEADRLAKAGNTDPALDTVARLMEEGVAEAQWMLGGWLYYGYDGMLDAEPDRGLILFKNAANQGHLEAMKWLSMAYWEGTGVPVDQQKAMDYMGYVAQRGDPMAEAIYGSMLLEPVRQENARRQAEMAAAASSNRNNFWASVNASVDSWIASMNSSSSSSSSSSSWQSTGSIMDQGNWNQFINSMEGGSVCPSYNPYC